MGSDPKYSKKGTDLLKTSVDLSPLILFIFSQYAGRGIVVHSYFV